MEPKPTQSQEIQIHGGVVIPRRVGLGAVASLVALTATLIAFGVRAENRITRLEDQAPDSRLRRVERVLCALCASEPATRSNPACASICQE